jgi:hypothetical protein
LRLELNSADLRLTEDPRRGERMPSDPSDPVAHWQALADEARAAAEEMVDPQSRVILLTIAQGYERLAKRAKDRTKQNDQDSKT